MADDQPMWGNNRAVAPTPGAAIVVVNLGDNFTVKGHHCSMIKDRKFNGLGRADPHKHIAEFVEICKMFRYGTTNANTIKLKLFSSSLAGDAKIWFNELSPGIIATWEQMRQAFDMKAKPICKTVAFAESSNDSKLIEKMEALTTKIDSQFKDIKREMKEMRDGCYNCGGPHLSLECNDKPIGGPKEPWRQLHRERCQNMVQRAKSRDYRYLGTNETSFCKPIISTRNHQASIQDLEIKFGRLSDQCSSRPIGSLPSNTQTNPKPSPTNDKPYRPPSAQNEHGNTVFTWSGLTYDSRVNPNTKTTVIHDDSEDEVDEAKKEVEPSSSKQTKYDPPPLKAYKLKIPINVPLVDVLAGMPKYGKFLKDLVSNTSKMEQISAGFLNEECSAIVQNKLLPKLGDYGSFLIPCTIVDYYFEDQYAVSIKEDTAYPCLHSPKTTKDKAQYAVSRETQYAVFKIWNEYNILKDIKRGPYSKKFPIRRIQLLGYAVSNRIPDPINTKLKNKEKMEERYAKFIDLIKEVRINVPLVDVLAGMPKYGKFLKDLVSNTSKMEQISDAFLNEECSAIVQNKLPPKLGDYGSFLIPCTIAGSVEYLALALLCGPRALDMMHIHYAKARILELNEDILKITILKTNTPLSIKEDRREAKKCGKHRKATTRTSSNTRNKNVDTTPRYKNDNQNGQFGNQRTVNVAGARETIGGQVVQQSGIQCFNCKGFGVQLTSRAILTGKQTMVKILMNKRYNTDPDDNVFANEYNILSI
ncbi:hypothetical protein Tco_0128444 [Tanacetum coccineum]